MVQCRKCDKDVLQTKDGCKCVDCNSVFHILCVSETFKTRGSQKIWKCEECAVESLSTSGKSATERDQGHVAVLEAIAALRTDMIGRWDINDGKLDKMQNDIAGINNEISDLKLELHNIKTETNKTEGNIERLVDENRRLKEELNNVKLDLQDLQQYTRKNNIIVSGIPAMPRGAEVYPLLQQIARLLDIPYYRSDLNVAHWLPVREEGDLRTRPIVVSFVSRIVKNEWLSARRNRKILKASEIDASFPDSQVYLNEQLTQQSRSLFNGARSAMKDGKLTSVWTSDGRVMAKRSPTGRPFRVMSLQDLEKKSSPSQITDAAPPQHLSGTTNTSDSSTPKS